MQVATLEHGGYKRKGMTVLTQMKKKSRGNYLRNSFGTLTTAKNFGYLVISQLLFSKDRESDRHLVSDATSLNVLFCFQVGGW